MKLVIVSDLHFGFGSNNNPWEQTQMYSGPNDEVLCVLGDCGPIDSLASQYSRFFGWASKKYRHVLFVYGNHEFYSEWSNIQTMDSMKKIMRSIVKPYDNVHILDNSSYVIDDVAFIGATFWTDMNNKHPFACMDAYGINDFHVIYTTKDSVLTPEQSVDFHMKSKSYIRNTMIHHHRRGKKTVVLTHHAPSLLSIHPKYCSGNYARMNPCFSSNCDQLILDGKPVLWAHGHTHTSFDYVIGDTRVICNPHGYGFENYLDFSWGKTIDV